MSCKRISSKLIMYMHSRGLLFVTMLSRVLSRALTTAIRSQLKISSPKFDFANVYSTWCLTCGALGGSYMAYECLNEIPEGDEHKIDTMFVLSSAGVFGAVCGSLIAALAPLTVPVMVARWFKKQKKREDDI